MISIKKNDDKRAMVIELIRRGKKIIVPEDSKIVFKADNGMCKEMILLEGNYVIAFSKEDTKEVGFFNGEVEVTYKEDGRQETFPDSGFIKFRIHDNIICEVEK